MVEAAIATERSQRRLQPGEAREFAEWIEAPRRSFLPNLIIKLLITAAVIITLSWAIVALQREAAGYLCAC